MNKEIKYVKADELEAIYIDNILVYDTHKVTVEDLIRVFTENGIEAFKSFYNYQVDMNWFEEQYHIFPRRFEDLKLEEENG